MHCLARTVSVCSICLWTVVSSLLLLTRESLLNDIGRILIRRLTWLTSGLSTPFIQCPSRIGR